MKRTMATLLAAMLLMSVITCAVAEESAFDPCASLWYWDHSTNTTTNDDGTVFESYFDYRWPQYSYAVFEYRPDGTYTQTTTTAIGEVYTHDGTWEKISDNQIQLTETVDEGEGSVSVLYYEDGVMKEYYSNTYEAIEGYSQGSTVEGVTVYSDDPDGSLREAMAAYQITDNMDANADESVFKRDLIMYGFLNYAVVYLYGMENPIMTTMDPFEAEGWWYGSISWLDDETVSFKLHTNDELFEINTTCVPTMATMDGMSVLYMELPDATTDTVYSVVLMKHADSEMYRVQFLSSNGIPVYFQAVPAEIYNR